jgi:hypothetical protein
MVRQMGLMCRLKSQKMEGHHEGELRNLSS